MRFTSKKWRWVGGVLAVLVVAFVGVRTWVVPAVIRAQLKAHYGGRADFRDWWFGPNSSGLTGVELGETSAADSPTWFSADRISTDVSLDRLIRGKVMPTRVEIDGAKVVFRLDAKGQPSTKIPLVPETEDKAAKAAAGPMPEIVAKGGELTLHQEGRSPMKIVGVDANLKPSADGEDLDIKTDDPTWGQVKIKGHFDPTFKNGQFEIDSSPGFVAEPAKIASIPFIPAEVWTNLEPRGPVDAKVTIKLAADAAKPVAVHTELTLKGTTAKLESLQVVASETTGRVVIDDALVKLQDIKGKTLDGSMTADGTLDFSAKVPRFDIDLRLKEVDVTKAPASWQLNEIGATGKLSGRVGLKVALGPTGADLGGTSGKAVIENGSFQGIPIQSLSLGLKADGNDLQYATLPQGSVDKLELDKEPATPVAIASAPAATTVPAPRARAIPAAFDGPLKAALPILQLVSRERGALGWSALAALELNSFQEKKAGGKGGGGLRLPKTISTQIELADVDLATLLAKAKRFGIEIPVPVSGKFSIKADATIPLGSLKDLKGYVFKGDATLKAASIDHVDLGVVSLHVELVNGVLDLTDLRGQLVDRPGGDAQNPPAPTAPPPHDGPLPPGAFRGRLHASISPGGPASARFEGARLPIGELFAPVLPVPTPVSGELSINVEAAVDIAKLADPRSWTLDGRVESRRIKYQDATLDEVVTEAHVKGGRLDVADFSARLLGRPLKAKGHLDLAAPYRYAGNLSIEGWEIAKVLGFVPNIPKPAPASGTVDARGEAVGSLQPFEIATHGDARIAQVKAGPTPLGNVAFRWTTDREWVSVTGLEIFAYGGKITGEARIPTRPGKLLEASATVKGIDSARLSSTFLGQKPSIAGKADGRLKLIMPLDASTIDAEANLDAPDFRISENSGEGVEVRSVRVVAVARKGMLQYEATAEGLGGKVRFHGSAPVVLDLTKAVADGELLAVNFRLSEVWKGMGMAGGLSGLDGLGAFDINSRVTLQPFHLWSRGIFELRDLRYGKGLALGNVRGVASLTPSGWRVEQVNGDLLGGVAMGEAHGESRPDGSKQVAFDFHVNRASLARMTTAVPSLARQVEGYGSLRVAGRFSESLQANAEVLVPQARVLGLVVTDLRFPAEVELNPASGIGSVHARHWTARVAGGAVRGSSSVRLGTDKSFQSEVQLTGVNLESISKLQGTGKKAISGKVSGKVTLNGPNPEQIAKMRGRIDLDLDDASLVELPVFKELDRFLGSARGGGLFEDGDIHATVANRTLFVEQLTLNGRLIQVHATGSITFDGGLGLEVLVNTKDVIPQSGLALINVIPGLGQAIGRGEQAVLRVASFLENRLLKFRVTGTVDSPNVQLDPGVAVGDTAVGFFSSVLKVPSGGR